MSYDIHVDLAPCAHCGRGAQAMGEWSFTSNCAPMWRKAGADLATFDGKTAGECVPIVRSAIATIESDIPTYEAMNSPNGWGSVYTLLPALVALAELFEAYPAGIVRVRR